MIGFPECYTEVAGYRLAYLDIGENRNPILFIHGAGGDLGDFSEIYGVLAQERRVLAVDLPGFGGSGTVLRGDPIPVYTEVVFELLGSLGVDSTDIVGHSMGGLVAMRVALRNPALINRMVLLAPAGLSRLPAAYHDSALARWRADRLMGMTTEELHAWYCAFANERTPLLLRSLSQKLHTRDQNEWASWSMNIERAIESVLRHSLSDQESLRHPFLVAMGDKDPVLPWPWAPDFVERHPRLGRLERLPGCGHLPMFERSREVLLRIREFLHPESSQRDRSCARQHPARSASPRVEDEHW